MSGIIGADQVTVSTSPSAFLSGPETWKTEYYSELLDEPFQICARKKWNKELAPRERGEGARQG